MRASLRKPSTRGEIFCLSFEFRLKSLTGYRASRGENNFSPLIAYTLLIRARIGVWTWARSRGLLASRSAASLRSSFSRCARDGDFLGTWTDRQTHARTHRH